MANDKNGYYAMTRWHPADIQSLTTDENDKPAWTLKQAKAWLANNEKYIRDGITERGWDIIRNMMPAEPDSKNYKE